MVRGSLCPLLVLVRGSSPVGDDDLWYHHIGKFSPFFLLWLLALEPAERTSELARRASEPARRALDPVEKASEHTKRASDEVTALKGPRINLGELCSQVGGSQSEQTDKPFYYSPHFTRLRSLPGPLPNNQNKNENGEISPIWWYHRSSSLWGRCPKNCLVCGSNTDPWPLREF